MAKQQNQVKLFNTMSKSVEVFKPIADGKAGIYSCGPTVYSTPHIGNMRAFIFADVLSKTLSLAGFSVNHVMNITDVGHLTSDADSGEDKMQKQAKKDNTTAFEVAKKYTKIFLDYLDDLNIQKVSILCKATDHIKEQIELIQTLEVKGFTYKTSDGIYFDTSRIDNYGALAKLDIEGLRGGDRVDLGEKKNKTDFALWKFSPDSEKRDMEWDSPWGVGFPGWHIECSAMSKKYLGDVFDIHTGGVDHIPVHHTNEIAQSECATGHVPANYWLHCEHLNLVGEKMSKSLGNIVTIDSLKEQGFKALAFRFLMLQTHYRKNIQYSYAIMEQAFSGYNNLKSKILAINNNIKMNIFCTFEANSELFTKYENDIKNALFDDLNTAMALGILNKALNDDLTFCQKIDLVKMADKVLSLDLLKEDEKVEIPYDIINLASDRQIARLQKNWALADEIKLELARRGYEVIDTKEGFEVKCYF